MIENKNYPHKGKGTNPQTYSDTYTHMPGVWKCFWKFWLSLNYKEQQHLWALLRVVTRHSFLIHRHRVLLLQYVSNSHTALIENLLRSVSSSIYKTAL